MRRIARTAFFLPSIMLALAAHADQTRSFVSSYGSDSNDCSRQAPCRSFATALTKTIAGGEINTLDPGGYGAVTITKAISIVSGLGEAGVLVPAGGTGITISAGATDRINLRGLAIEGAGTGATGIRFNSGGALTISNSVIRNLTAANIDLEPTATTTFVITNTLVTDGRVGIYVYPQGLGVANGTFERVTVTNHQWGLYGNAIASATSKPITLSVIDSSVSHNTAGDGIGVYAQSPSSSVRSRFDLVGTTVSGNTIGAKMEQFGYVLMQRSHMDSNGTNFVCTGSGASFWTWGDNAILSTPSCLVAQAPGLK